MRLSRVRSGTPWTTLVAAINSSAGSPSKSSRVDSRATTKSIGQTLIGRTASATHQAGIGYWYGITIDTTTSDCFCGELWGDLNEDVEINPVDVVYLINYVYKFLDALPDYPDCPKEPGDANCNDTTNAVDVIYYINYVYKAQGAMCADPCTP